MILSHFDIERKMDFSKNDCYSLIIENANEFFRLTKEMYNQVNGEEGNFVLYENGILEIKRKCLFIYDYYTDIFSNKKVINILNTKILDFLKEHDFLSKFSQLNKIMIDINEQVAQEISANLEFNQEFGYDSFIKFSNYKFTQNKDFVENLVNYIDFYVQSTKTQIVIFVHLFSVLNKEQIEQLIKQMRYMQLNVLLIDSRQIYKLKDVETIIIDEDLCVI